MTVMLKTSQILVRGAREIHTTTQARKIITFRPEAQTSKFIRNLGDFKIISNHILVQARVTENVNQIEENETTPS